MALKLNPMKPKLEPAGQKDNLELVINDIERKIEDLKTQFNLFFSGEIKVPPEKDREDIEKRIRNMVSTSHRSPRINLLVQNISSRFTTYNSMWLKRLNDLETGGNIIKRKKPAYDEEPQKLAPKAKPEEKKAESKSLHVSLNSEESFDKLYDQYSQLLSRSGNVPDKDKLINTLKTKLITSNLVDAKVDLSVEDGKLKVKIKSAF